MPTSKKSAPAKKSPPAPHLKKKPGPPPPHDEEPHKKHGKPGKKHPGKHEDKPGGKHLRRAYEHLGRVEALQGLAALDSVTALVHLAKASVDQGEARPAADLLRAAEHLSFAAAAATSKSTSAVSPDLEEAVRREFRKLLEHAEEHDLSKASTLGKLLRQTLSDACFAFESQSFRQALELARAAEALASLDPHVAERLGTPTPDRALES